MKKILLLFLLCTGCSGFFIGLRARKVGTLEHLLFPRTLEIAHNRVYCMQEATVYLYTLKDLTFIKTFCKEGEGPGELKISPGISNFLVASGDSILAVGIDKFIVYSPDGIFRQEFRLPRRTGHYLYPLEKNRYLGLKFDTNAARTKPYLVAGIMNEEFIMIKELYRQKFTGGQNLVNLTADGINLAVSKGKIYIEESARGFVISVYDLEGNLLNRIKKDLPPVKFTRIHKKRALNHIKQNPALKAIGWENFKNSVRFTQNETVPLIEDLLVDGDRLFIRSNNFKENEHEFVVLDQLGKVIKKVWVPQPLPTDFNNLIFGRPARYYKIYKGKYYYLMENSDQETWELHVEDMGFRQ